MVRSARHERHLPFVALNQNDASQQLVRSHGRIVIKQPVAAGNQGGCRGAVPAAERSSPDHSMDKEACIAKKKYDLSGGNILDADAADRNEITRKNSVDHARAVDTEADLSERTDDLFRESTRYFGRSLEATMREHICVGTICPGIVERL
jgi:hypothetical protein